MVSISVSARSLAAARKVDPNVSAAAVRAAGEAAIAEHLRETRSESRHHEPERRPDATYSRI